MFAEKKWSNNLYTIETPELKEKLYKQNAIQKIKGYKFEELSVEQIRLIVNILNQKQINEKNEQVNENIV